MTATFPSRPRQVRLPARAAAATAACVAAVSLAVAGCTSGTGGPSAGATSASVASVSPSSSSSAPVAKSAFVVADQLQAPGGFDLVGEVSRTSSDVASGWSAVLRSRDAAADPAHLAAGFVESNVALGFKQSAIPGGVRLTSVRGGAHVTVDVLRPASGTAVLARVLTVTTS